LAVERLALGTVQFGQDYGVANRTGRVAKQDVAAILERARQAGIDMLDTGAEYGVAESVLGEVGVAEWRVVTKLPAGDPDPADPVGWVMGHTAESLKRLGIERLHGLLVHRPHHLDRVGAGLIAAREAGLTDRIGASVYSPGDLDEWWTTDLDLVQAPCNALDRRLSATGWLDRLAGSGVEVHSRSAFLQGLLLMDDRPEPFQPWSEVLGRWDEWATESGAGRLGAALGAVLADERIDRVVVGVDSLDHLEEILGAVEHPLPSPPEHLAAEDLDLIDPSRWEAN
jgi:aryl-alcohol dehydrogenase-like predicted oxidoreductase